MPTFPTPPTELRVMTFNLRNSRAEDGPNRWPNRREIATDLIARRYADIIGVQEAYRDQLGDILRARPEYGEIGGGRGDGKSAGEHSQILYRRDRFGVADSGTFWFSDTPDVPGSTSWGNRNTRICTWALLTDRQSETSFYVYNLHIDHESQPSRERSVTLLLETIRERKTADPVIVMGDFNAGEDNPIMQTINTQADPPLQDTFRALHPEEQDAGTFHGFNGGRTGDKIDFIFASAPFRVQDAAILRDNLEGRYPSDHYPVTARLLNGR